MPVPLSHDLQAGDVIFFLTPEKPLPIQRLIMHAQRIFGQQQGQENVVHVAICTGYNEAGRPMIAQVTEDKGIKGFEHESIDNLFARDGLTDRPYISYRSSKPLVAKTIADLALIQRGKTFKWSKPHAVFATLRKSVQKERDINKIIALEKSIDLPSFCSKFATQIVQTSITKLMNAGIIPKAAALKFFPKIRSASTPHTVEAAFHSLPGFQPVYHYASTLTPIQAIEGELNKQITRFAELGATNPKYQIKHDRCVAARKAFLDACTITDDREKAVALCKHMLPLLQERTKLSFLSTQTGSAKALVAVASRFAIYKRDIDPSIVVAQQIAKNLALGGRGRSVSYPGTLTPQGEKRRTRALTI